MKAKKKSKNPKFKDVVINNLVAKHAGDFNKCTVDIGEKVRQKRGKKPKHKPDFKEFLDDLKESQQPSKSFTIRPLTEKEYRDE